LTHLAVALIVYLLFCLQIAQGQTDYCVIMGGGHHINHEAMPKQNQDLEALKAARIPLAFRDTCGHLLIKLNECRRETLFNPHKCGHERHTYEECGYYAYLQRVEAKKQEARIRQESG
jgi:NADH dehydrogenase (ubiquinone) 1 beta subcomplex subunit 7